ncbi:MAG: hypothetical protein LUE99_07365 [Bacteroides sp.]|nr:hypothetical protein [Bacteroides sp.]
MKRIYRLMTAALMLAGAALWNGCDNNELADATDGNGTAQEVRSFNFSIKGLGAQTRAITDEGEGLESTVKTMYVAMFLKDNASEGASKLHKIFCYDDNTESGWSALKLTEADGTYIITTPGTVGDYIVYFIANPDKKIKEDLLTMQQDAGPTRATLSTFESNLATGDGTADGNTDDEGKAAAAGSERGFIMLGKENITLSEYTTAAVTLTRLAARFDFINSAAIAGVNNEVKITKIEFGNSGKSSIVAETAAMTEDSRCENKTYDLSASGWDNQVGEENKYTAYAYENLNTENPIKRTLITVYYTLGTVASTENKKLNIDLKEGENYIGVTRNHLYRIYLNGVSGQFKLTVEDWKEGNTVKVPNEELAITYTAADLGKVGDIAYINDAGELAFFDGGLRKVNLDGTYVWNLNERRTLTASEQSKCIGIVFSNSTTAAEKKDGYTHGQVMSLLNFGKRKDGTAYWKTEKTDDGDFKTNTEGDMVGDCNGYLYCSNIKAKADFPAKYPALSNLQNWSVKAPASTSGWYIPSLGQMFAVFNNLSSWKISQASRNNFTPGSSWAYRRLK